LFSSRRRLAGRLVYFTTGFAVCQQLFQTFPVLCARLPVRPAKAAGPFPVVQPAAPDCLLILAPAGAFVNREFAFWGGIVVS